MAEITVVGSCVIDLAFYSERLPATGETVESTFRQGLGGKGFNQAVAARKSGSIVSFIGSIGLDEFGRKFESTLSDLQIPSTLYPFANSATGMAAILLANVDNKISVALGANKLLKPSDVKLSKDTIIKSKILLVQLETNLEAVEQALKIAKKHEVMTILNPAPALEPLPKEILKLVDILTPNETELTNLTGVKVDTKNAESIWEACAVLKNHGSKLIIPTLGKEGCAIYKDAYLNDDEIWVKARQVKAIDTAGAGDCFNGCFATGMIRFSGDVNKAVKFATAACSLSVQRQGTSESMPSKEEIEKVL